MGVLLVIFSNVLWHAGLHWQQQEPNVWSFSVAMREQGGRKIFKTIKFKV